MELLKIFLITVGGVILFMSIAQLFVRWRTKKMVGKEITRFGKNVILYFYSPGCGACVKMEPIINSLSKKVKVKKVNVSEKEGLAVARELGILGTPTTVVIKDGKVQNVFVGFQKEERILKEVR